MTEMILSWLIGLVSGVIVTIVIESLKKPVLDICIVPATVADYPLNPTTTNPEYVKLDSKFPARKARYLTLEAHSKSLPRWASWMLRSAAADCEGEINFYDMTEQRLFNRAMPIRWVDSPEPLPLIGVTEGAVFKIIDPNVGKASNKIDIHPGQRRRFDVAAKFDSDDECYGWTNDNYTSDPLWRNPAWRFRQGSYIVEVVLYHSGITTKKNSFLSMKQL